MVTKTGATMYLTLNELIFIRAKSESVDTEDAGFDKELLALNNKVTRILSELNK